MHRMGKFVVLVSAVGPSTWFFYSEGIPLVQTSSEL